MRLVKTCQKTLLLFCNCKLSNTVSKILLSTSSKKSNIVLSSYEKQDKVKNEKR